MAHVARARPVRIHSPEKAIDRAALACELTMYEREGSIEKERQRETERDKARQAGSSNVAGAGLLLRPSALCSLEKWMINYEITSVNASMKGDCIVKDNLLTR